VVALDRNTDRHRLLGDWDWLVTGASTGAALFMIYAADEADAVIHVVNSKPPVA